MTIIDDIAEADAYAEAGPAVSRATVGRLMGALREARAIMDDTDPRELCDCHWQLMDRLRDALGGCGDPDPYRQESDMRGPLGYGRYDDDLDHVGCPRAQSDMTPCVARDGNVACADDGRCVACAQFPADLLRDLVREITEPKVASR